MTQHPYPSKERVERDGVLVYPEGDPIPFDDVDELERQGYTVDGEPKPGVVAPERIERDGVLLYAEGDPIDPNDRETLESLGADVSHLQDGDTSSDDDQADAEKPADAAPAKARRQPRNKARTAGSNK